MADPKQEPSILDDIEALEAEAEQLLADEAAAEEALDGEEEDVVDEVAALQEEVNDLKDRLLRSLAEAENIRKRADRDRREAENYGGSKLARDMLPVYDNLQRALDAAGDEQKDVAGAVLEGIELTLRELLNVFGKHGIERVAPEVGDAFDPDFHQAMFEAPVPETKAGDIIQVMAEGFMLHDRLLRPAQVGVSSNPG
ncbi:MAG: nucleotide exchange factor GrpE [Pseudomonadota bacterium]